MTNANVKGDKKWYIPCTPAGTACIWLKSRTREAAINKLLKDAAHMPYGTWDNFEKRGYTIEEWDEVPY